MNGIEWIKQDEETIAVIIRASVKPETTTFITPETFTQQGGFVVYPAGGAIPPHDHKPVERHIIGTAETLIVRQGAMIVDLFNSKREIVATKELSEGDVIMLVSGGHGFRMLADTILFEVKQGPYTGLVEKERF